MEIMINSYSGSLTGNQAASTSAATYAANKLLLEEATNNYTDYINLMDPLIADTLDSITLFTSYINGAQGCVDFMDASNTEFNGYLMMTVSFNNAWGALRSEIGNTFGSYLPYTW